MSWGVGHRCSSDPELLWLWCRPGATAPIWPLAWELPYAAGADLKRPKKKKCWEFPSWLSGLRTQLGSMRMQVWSLASFSGLRIWHCCELWYRSQLRLGSRVHVAVVEASRHGFDSAPSLGTSICCGCSPKKQKTNKKQILLLFSQI